jgi:predicted lactoylglutathione lyase
MLLTHDKFRQFTPKRIADAHQTSEVLICISADSREGVDDVTVRAIAAGGRELRDPQDLGFMYSRSFEDPDGHVWEPAWMDIEGFAAPTAEPQPQAAEA